MLTSEGGGERDRKDPDMVSSAFCPFLSFALEWRSCLLVPVKVFVYLFAINAKFPR